MRIVISQPMYFPWIGFLEQIRLCDVFVRYDDVQYSKGSFTNRVQIKTPAGSQWLTVPLKRFAVGTPIRGVFADEEKGWRRVHLEKIRQNYMHSTHYKDAISLAESVLSKDYTSIDKISWQSVSELCDYFEISSDVNFISVDSVQVEGNGSDRVLEIVKSLKGTIYITGHGAKNYLDHHKFDSMGISVEYMNYKCTGYPQLYGNFTPYVSALDLVANCGRDGRKYISSETVNWQVFTNNYSQLNL